MIIKHVLRSKFSILLIIILSIIIFLSLIETGICATTTGTLTEDEIWVGTVEITGDVIVPSGITLTIDPGTVIEFISGEGLELIVEGALIAEGNAENPIMFTSNAQEPAADDWTWIYFGEESEGSLHYCTIMYANTGCRIKASSPVIANSTLEQNCVGINLGNSNAEIVKNRIAHNGIGITADYSQPAITHNHICNNTYDGVILSHGSEYSELRHNLIYGNGENGLLLKYSSLVPIINNTINNNGGDGIYLKKECIPQIINNLITHNQGYGISCWQSSWPTVLYNDLFDNTGRNYYDYASGASFTPLPGAGELNEDPLYIDEGIPDLHLQSGSSAIDAGDPSSAYDQEPQPNGGRINMGAYGNTPEAALSCEPQNAFSFSHENTGAAGESVVIPLNATINQGIMAIENLVIRYVASVLKATAVTPSGIGTDLSLSSNISTPGEIRISAFTTSEFPVVGQGDILEITFDIIGNPGDMTPLDLISVKQVLGELDEHVCTEFSDGVFTILSEVSISGESRYYSHSSPVPDVRLTLTDGYNNYETLSDSVGAWSLTDIPDGMEYTLTPVKEGDSGGSIGIYDAVLIARQTVGLESFGSAQTQAADINATSGVDIGDAVLIAKYTVGLESLPFPVGLVWGFDPPQRTYSPLIGAQEEQNFIALLYGDVDGDWQHETLGSSLTVTAQEKDIIEQGHQCEFSLPMNTSAQSGQSIQIALDINAHAPILGLSDLILHYNPEVLDAQNVENTSFSEDFIFVSNLNTPGEIRLSAFGSNPLAGAGALALLTFNVTGESGDLSLLEFEGIADIIGEGEEPIEGIFNNGSFMVPCRLSIPDGIEVTEGEGITVPLSLSKFNEIYGLENLTIHYSSSVLEVQDINLTSLTDDFTLISNLDTPGQIRISLFGSAPCSGEGDILTITFRVIGSLDEMPIDGNTLSAFAGEFGEDEIGQEEASDFDGDGDVDGTDLYELVKSRGSTTLDLLSLTRLVGYGNHPVAVDLIDGELIVVEPESQSLSPPIEDTIIMCFSNIPFFYNLFDTYNIYSELKGEGL
ncbi:MAG: cohesin domain-containing protein [bacterium]